MSTHVMPDLEQLHGDTEVALDRWLASQLEFNQDCQVTPIDGRPAAWLQICRFCDHTVPMCADHHDSLAAWADKPHPNIEWFICESCHKQTKTLAGLVMFIPVGAAE